MEPSIRTQVRSFVITTFLFGQQDNLVDDDSSFLAEGIIDSTGVLELVSHLEQTYNIKVEDEELLPENLDSISNIVLFLRRKLNGSSVLAAETCEEAFHNKS